MVGHALADDVITEAEEGRIAAVSKLFRVGYDDPVFSGPAFKLKKCAVLRDLGNGKYPSGIEIDTGPAVMDPDDKPIWLFNGVERYELRPRTVYHGRSQGVSVRVMKGVYFRLGAFKGEPVRTQELQLAGKGALMLGSKFLTFIATPGALRIPLKKIIQVEPYSDGLAITREGVNPKPQVFLLDDPWFAVNAVNRLATM